MYARAVRRVLYVSSSCWQRVGRGRLCPLSLDYFFGLSATTIHWNTAGFLNSQQLSSRNLEVERRAGGVTLYSCRRARPQKGGDGNTQVMRSHQLGHMERLSQRANPIHLYHNVRCRNAKQNHPTLGNPSSLLRAWHEMICSAIVHVL